jgi:serine/threonine protein kinase/WD40 repeat protein
MSRAATNPLRDPDERVWDLVAEFLERRERGEPLDIDRFVAGHPEIAAPLRAQLEAFTWMERAVGEASRQDGEFSVRSGVAIQPSGQDGVGLTPGSEFGEYRIARRVGSGGMAVVYEAVHQTLGRRVALKVMNPALLGADRAARFLREARTAARLHHTHIVPVFDMGQTDGLLYFAMQFIEGESLDRVVTRLRHQGEAHAALDTSAQAAALAAVREALPVAPPPSADESVVPREAADSELARLWPPNDRLSPLQVARLGLQAAGALAYAHARGVVHRDIKPSNLIVDHDGSLWVADFGLARGPDDPALTSSGIPLGTPRYMSPEQAAGQPVNHLSDTYSLGVTLYELLALRPAFEGTDPQQVLHRVMHDEPLPLVHWNPAVPRDLESIVLRAMAKQPRDRYSSAVELSDDLRRFLRLEPVRARRIGPVGRLARWCRRNPLLATVSSGAVLALAAVAGTYHTRVVHERDRADQGRADAQLRLAEVQYLNALAVLASDRPGRSREALANLRESAAIRFHPRLWPVAIRALDCFDLLPLGTLTPTAEPIAPPGLAARIEGSVTVLAACGGEWPLVAGTDRGELFLTDPITKQQVPLTTVDRPVVALAAGGRGQSVAVATDQAVWICGTDWRQARDPKRILPGAYQAIVFSPDGRRVAACGPSLAVWDVAGERLIWQQPLGEPVAARCIAWSSDGKTLAVSGSGAEVKQWVVPDGRPLAPLTFDEPPAATGRAPLTIRAIAFDAETGRLACGCSDGALRLLDRVTGRITGELNGHRGHVQGLAFGPAGWLASHDERELIVWDLVRQRPLASLPPDWDGLRTMAVDPQGRWLAAGNQLGQVGVWAPPDRRRHGVLSREPRRVQALAAAPNKRRVAWADPNGHVAVLDLDRPDDRREFDTGWTSPRIAFSPDGAWLAMAGAGEPRIGLRHLDSGKTRSLACDAIPLSFAFRPGTDQLAVAGSKGDVTVWKLGTEKPYATVPAPPVTALAYSSDGRWLAASASDGVLRLWSASSFQTVASTASGIGACDRLVFSGDGSRLATAGFTRGVRVWQVPELRSATDLEDSDSAERDVAFGLGDSTLIARRRDGTLMLWSARDGYLIATLAGRSTGSFDALCTTPDGRQLIAGGGPAQLAQSTPGSVELWDLELFRRAVLDADLPPWDPPTASPAPKRLQAAVPR